MAGHATRSRPHAPLLVTPLEPSQLRRQLATDTRGGAPWAGVLWNAGVGAGLAPVADAKDSVVSSRARLLEYFTLISDTEHGGVLV